MLLSFVGPESTKRVFELEDQIADAQPPFRSSLVNYIHENEEELSTLAFSLNDTYSQVDFIESVPTFIRYKNIFISLAARGVCSICANNSFMSSLLYAKGNGNKQMQFELMTACDT